jgi:hypothetical protein
MCLQCHGPPRPAMEGWKREVKEIERGNQMFEQVNTSVVLMMIYSMCGHDIDPDDETVAQDSKLYATMVFENYMRWYQQNKKDRYFPDRGTETMFSRGALHEVDEYIQKNEGLDQMKMIEGCLKILSKDQKNVMKTWGQFTEERKRHKYYLDAVGFFIGFVIASIFMKAMGLSLFPMT